MPSLSPKLPYRGVWEDTCRNSSLTSPGEFRSVPPFQHGRRAVDGVNHDL